MSNILKSKVLLGAMIAGAVFVGAMLMASSASAAYTHSTTLKMGSTGSQVMSLQQTLNANGFLVSTTGAGSPGMESSYFGAKTKAAVLAFQGAKGLGVDGVVGPNTGTALAAMGGAMSGNFPAGCTSAAGYSSTTGVKCDSGPSTGLPAGCSSTAGYSPLTGTKCDSSGSAPSGPLAGTDGTIADMTRLSQYNAEEVGSGQDDVKVLGFEVEASTDGDIKLNSMKVRFDSTGNGSGDSDRLEDYVASVSIWQGSTKVGSADTTDFTRVSSGLYTKVITLDSSVVRADTTEKFYIAVDAVGNLDSGDIDSDSWTIALDNVRYEDGGGVVTTESAEIPTDMDWDSAGDGISIAFVSFATASDTELKITVDSTLQAGVRTVNTTSDTNDVLLLKGTMKLEGTSDVWLDEVPFLFTTNATNVDGLTPTVYFTIDGTEYSESMTASAGTTEVITFNDLDKTLTPGTYTFTVKADVNDIETSSFDEGDYLLVELDATRRALIIAENSQGDQLTDGSEMTGVAAGTIQYFYSISPVVTVVSKSITPNDNGSNPAVSATAKMKLAITAQGGTLYLNGDDETTQAEEFFGIAVDGGDASSSISSYTFTPSGTYAVTNSGSDNEYYTLNEGDTMYVDIEAVVSEATGSSAILVGMKGDEILFGTDVTSGATRSANTLNFTTLLDLLKTGKTTLDS